MSYRHAVVWIDQHEAKIFHADDPSFGPTTIESPRRRVRRHPEVTAEHAHPADAQHFYHDVVRALEGATEILILGPATAKLELVRHVHKHDRALEAKIVGIETVDHPTDGQVVAYARRYFHGSDRMH
jgi:hypothetical protein